MQEFISKYKTEVGIVIAIIVVMFVPYIVISSGIIKSETTLQSMERLTKELTPLIIGILCGWIVVRAIKRNREDR